MAGKRKAKKQKEQREDLSRPSPWRLQHGDFSAPVRAADPETGSPVEHRRAVDTLGLMLANGNITSQMHEAGCIFRTLFRSAAIDSMSTSQLIRLPGSTADRLSDRQLDARRRVLNALDALGGHDSPAGSCVWFVVGLEMSVREWAARRGWSGRPVPQPIAGGIIVAALGILAMHFGLTPRQQAA
jgi:HEAT repeat protein